MNYDYIWLTSEIRMHETIGNWRKTLQWLARWLKRLGQVPVTRRFRRSADTCGNGNSPSYKTICTSFGMCVLTWATVPRSSSAMLLLNTTIIHHHLADVTNRVDRKYFPCFVLNLHTSRLVLQHTNTTLLGIEWRMAYQLETIGRTA